MLLKRPSGWGRLKSQIEKVCWKIGLEDLRDTELSFKEREDRESIKTWNQPDVQIYYVIKNDNSVTRCAVSVHYNGES